MSKTKTSFFCQHCGHQSVKWLGQCPGCGTWNSYVEEIVHKDNAKEHQDWSTYGEEKRKGKITTLDQVKSNQERRIITGDAELNRVLGGGIVQGSLILVAGEPGIGKSTLFLQT
ncbi:MAG: DNA repair protein RadA, partial [Bacteroidota bacterium]